MSDLLLLVRLAGERVAFLAADVEAVVDIDNVTPVPCAAVHVAGLAALRSRVVTVINPAAGLGHTDARLGPAAVATVDGHAYALLVDAVEDVLPADGPLCPLPGRLEGGWAKIASASVEVEGNLLLLIDIPALIAGPQAQAA